MTSDLEKYVGWGQEVLEAEAAALVSGARRMDVSFARVVERVLHLKGKVILTGLGKSGHVARKVAATLSSTGTPAFFLHPSEGLHGDMGVIGSDDFLLAIGFGGETDEVVTLLKHARRIGCETAVITGANDSTMSELANYKLDGYVEREACPLNLAPTCSSTLALAIGDALAISLMNARGFQSEDFAKYHPSGKLGRRLARVSEHMKAIDARVGLESPFSEVLASVTKHNFGTSAVVEENGKLLGVVTDGDLRRAILRDKEAIFSRSAGEIMTKDPKTVLPNDLALNAINLMESKQITSLFVVNPEDGKTLMGILRMHDLLAAKII